MKAENYILKEIIESDIKNIYKGLSDPDVTKYYDVHYSNLEEAQEQMDWYKNLEKTGSGQWWGIYSESNNQFCGAGGFNNLNKEHRKVEIGLWLLKEQWGKGILKKVTPLLLKKGFEEFNLNRIEGFVLSNNTKCKDALKKINFTKEGTLRESEIKNGEKISIDIYSILKSEWK